MRARIMLGLTLAFSAGLPVLCGCSVAPQTSHLARDFGVAHRLAIFGQIANPKAEENLAPVEGIDGKEALGTLTKHRMSFGYVPGMDMPTEFTKQYQIEKANQASAPKTFIDLPTSDVRVSVPAPVNIGR